MGKDTRPTERSQLPKEEGVTTFRPYSGFTRADRKKKKITRKNDWGRGFKMSKAKKKRRKGFKGLKEEED